MPGDDRFDLLVDHLRGLASAVVAFSGGVDSSLLLAASKVALPGRVLAITWQSEVITEEDIQAAEEIAQCLRVSHHVIHASFLENEAAAANPVNRCYFCRRRMYQEMRKKISRASVILEGTNADDLKEYRPGFEAAREAGVRQPLAELNLTKSEIRETARKIDMPNWDKEASPCLATRIAPGLRITLERLQRIARGERGIRALGFTKVRVRLLDDDHASVEVDKAEVNQATKRFPEIHAGLSRIGIPLSTIDPHGYRPGGLWTEKP